MAKAGIVYVGTSDGIVVFSDPASIGRWRRIGHALEGTTVYSLLAQTALSIHAALGADGVRHSDDGGQSWRGESSSASRLLAAHPGTPATLFAAATSSDLLRSDDSGATWAVCPQGDRPAEVITALLVDPYNAQRLLAGLDQSGVWVSADSGETWDALGAGLPPGIEHIAVSPNRPDKVFAIAGSGVWQAGEGGLWVEAASPLTTAPGGALAILPGTNEALLAAITGIDNGIARSVDDGDTWQLAVIDETMNANITVIAPATYHIDTAWAGTADGRLLLSDDRGRSWRTIARDLEQIHALAAVRLA